MTSTHFWEVLVPLLLAFEPTQEVVDRIDAHMHRYEVMNWEIGPRGDHGWFLAIPVYPRDSNASYLNELLSDGPQIEGWEVLNYKPRRPVNSTVRQDVGARTIEIPTEQFRYVIYVYPDGVAELDIYLPDQLLSDLGDDNAYNAAFHLTESALGGDVLRERVETVFIKPETERSAPGVSAQDLHQALTATLRRLEE